MEVLKLTQRSLVVYLVVFVLRIANVNCQDTCGAHVCADGANCDGDCKCKSGYDNIDSVGGIQYCLKTCVKGMHMYCASSRNTKCMELPGKIYRCKCLPGYSRSPSTGKCKGTKTILTSTDVYSQSTSVAKVFTTATTAGTSGSKATSPSMFVDRQTTTVPVDLTAVNTTAVPPGWQTLTIALAVGIGGAVLLAIIIALVVVLRRRRHTKTSSPTDIPHLRDLEGRANTAATSIHDYQSVFDPPLQVDRTAPSDLGVNVHARNHQHGFNPYEDVNDPTPYDATGYSAAAAGMHGNSQHNGGVPSNIVARKSPNQIAKAKEIPMDTYSNHTITANKAMQKKQKELRGEENPANAYHTPKDDGSKPATNEYDTTYSLFGSKGSNDTSTGAAENDRRQSGEVLYHELNRPKV